MRTKELSRILEMSVAQRILIVEEIWDSIVENPDSLPLTDSQKQELDKRLNSYYENPEADIPWEKVKERLLSSQNKGAGRIIAAPIQETARSTI